nr:retrovirus-related Pol polyprotein from transposon TNT 1-94 [Tanacetum cinerariifolium]
MSRDVLTVGSTMRIPLLYRGEYSQWVERFMNYLEEQTDGEAMISIKNDDQPLPHVTQVSIAGTTSTELPPLKDKSMWSDQEKRVQKIDQLILIFCPKVEMSRDVLTIGSTMRIPLLYRGEYSQWVERFMNYLEEQTDGEAMINSIKNGDQPLPRVTQGSIAGTTSTEQPPLKDKSMWSDQGKRIQKIDLNTFEEKNNEFNDQIKVLNEKNADLLAQTDVLQDQLKIKHVVIDTHTECQAKYAKLEEERYEYMIRFSTLCDNDKQHRKKIDEQDILFNKMSHNNSDDYFQEIINPDFEKIDSPFQQTSSFKPFVPNVILEKIIIDLEDEVVILLEKEKANLKIIESLKSKGFESSGNAIYETENQSENDCQVVEKECDKVENPKVLAPGMFKLSVSQSVSPMSMSKTSCDSKNVEKTSSAYVCNDAMNVSCNSRMCDLFDENNLFIYDDESVRISPVSKMPFRKKLRDSMNVSCNSRMCDLFDENNLFIYDDESVRISPVSKMPFRKKLRDSMNVCSKSNLNKSLPRTVHKWLPKMQPLAEPVAKWFPKIVQIYLWIIDSGCSKHMTGNRALLTNFVEKFLGTVHFGNNDFAVIADYGDVRVRTDNGTKFKNKILAKFFDKVGITQQFSAARTPQQNGVVERRNRTLVEAARTLITFANLPLFLWAEAIATDCFTQNRSIIHKRFDKTPYELMKKRKPNIKFFYVFGCRCYLLNDYEDVGKLKAKGDIRVFVGYSKESAPFRIYNKRSPSTSHNVFNERLEDAYFDASTSFHDLSNVHTFYQPYLHEKKWTKDQPLYKIIGDPKSSVRTRGQLANSCLFSCLLSSIKPANVAEALKDADWVSAM